MSANNKENCGVRLCVAQLAAAASGDVKANLRRLAQACRVANEGGADMLITPELFINGYDWTVSHSTPSSRIQRALDLTRCDKKGKGVDPIAAELIKISKENGGIEIITGCLEKRHYDSEKSRIEFYNSAIWISSSGIKAIYRKNHLWAENERKVFGCLAVNEDAVVEYAGCRFALLICYDIEFPENSRRLKLKYDIDCIVCLTAAGLTPQLSRSMIPARALENGVYVVYCNYPYQPFFGNSCIYAPNGLPLQHCYSSGDGYVGNEAYLFADIHQQEHRDFGSLPPYIKDRRPELYQALTKVEAAEENGSKTVLKSKL